MLKQQKKTTKSIQPNKCKRCVKDTQKKTLKIPNQTKHCGNTKQKKTLIDLYNIKKPLHINKTNLKKNFANDLNISPKK